MAVTANEQPELTYDSVKRFCREIDQPVVTTTDVKDHFGISQQAAYYRLDKLVERGEMVRKKIGASGNVWWLIES